MTKKLYRSRKNKVIGGVCGGLAEYFRTDPLLVRLITVFLMLVTYVWPVVLIYVIAWIAVPLEEGPKEAPVHVDVKDADK